MTTSISGTGGITFPDGSVQPAAASPYVNKNRIINGDFRIDQRNAGASVSVDNTERFVVDRFLIRSNASGLSATSQQSTTAPNNFVNSMIVSVTTGGTIAAATRGYIQQRIEGFNVADLGWGAAGASTVTLSFWGRSSKTGTFSGALQNDTSLGNRSYVFTYSISSANTWEQKSITITGDTTGTWYKNNLTGINVMFDLGNGSDLRTATTGSWVAGDYRGANSSVNIFDTSGATFYITGVQLEIGTSATPFERRMYGQELALCQRYYERRSGATYQGLGIAGNWYSTTSGNMSVTFPVPKRAIPSSSYSGISIRNGAGFSSVTSLAGPYGTNDTSGCIGCEITLGVASGGTAGYGASLLFSLGGGYLDFSAEL